MEGVGDIININGQMVCGSNYIDNLGCGLLQDCRVRLVEANAFHLGSTIFTMAGKVAVDVVTNPLYGWGKKSNNAGCSG